MKNLVSKKSFMIVALAFLGLIFILALVAFLGGGGSGIFSGLDFDLGPVIYYLFLGVLVVAIFAVIFYLISKSKSQGVVSE